MPGVGCYSNYDHYIATKGQPLSDSSQILNTGNEKIYPEGTSPERCLLLNPEPTPGYKEFIDAEHLMPLATSDFKQPVCVELNCLRREGLAPKALPETAPSLDSSEGDIARESDSNLYVNPLDNKTPSEPMNQQYKGVKKSTSGDSAMLCSKNSSQGSRQSLAQQADQSLTGSRSSLRQPLQPTKMGLLQPNQTPKPNYQGSKSSLGQTLESSRGSLNESLPKHRKTRFQQEWNDDEKRPPRGIATRIINHHIFGGKNGSKRSAWSSEQDSLRARSILKNKEARGTDSEFLIQDVVSLGANGDSGNESSPVRRSSFKQNNCTSDQETSDQLLVSDTRKSD